MSEAEGNPAELPLDSAGAQLRRAREAAGLSRSDIAARTKIAERHLTSIEDGNYGALASRTYVVGFSRNYARAVGLDEDQIADTVRAELAAVDFGEDRRQVSAFEPGDPARVPGARLAWLAALGGLAILLAGIVFLWRSWYAPGATLPELTATETPAPVAAATSTAPASQGPVTITALEPSIWVKFYDATGAQLMQKELGLGETYTVPSDANGPLLWTARPDALQVAVGGRVLPKLSDKQQTMKDVPVTAAALLARSAVPVPVPATASPMPASTAASPAAAPAAAPTAAPVTRPAAIRTSPPRASAPAAPAAAPAPTPAQSAAPAPAAPPAATNQQPSTVSQ